MTALRYIVAVFEINAVITCSTKCYIVAAARNDAVIASASVEVIIAAIPEQYIVTLPCHDHVVV